MIRFLHRIALTLFISVVMTMPISTIEAADSQTAPTARFWRDVIATGGARQEPSWISSRTSAAAQQCCRICTTGKACGDSCIARDKTCHVGPGCACDG